MNARPHISDALIVANISVFLAAHIVGAHVALVDRFAFGLGPLLAGRLETVVVSAFLHADLSHLLYNMLFLFVFGRGCEADFGQGRALLVYGGGVLLGAASFAAFFPAHTAIGASGGVFALMTATLLIEPGRPVYDPGGLAPTVPVGFLGVLYLLATVPYAFTVAGGTAHIAHLGGAVAGGLLAYLWRPERVRETVPF